MSDLESQDEEFEVLSSIYPTEFEIVSLEPPRRLKVALVPHPPGCEENHVAISLLATLPSDYPSGSPPELSIEVQKGLGAKQRDELKALADATALANMGMPAIFTVCEALKEWLCDNNVAGQDGSMYSEMLRREQKKDTDLKKKEEKMAISKAADMEVAEKVVDPEEEERIRRRQAGQPVTVESFNAWKTRFDEELRVQAAMFNGGVAPSAAADARLSGKQLFLLNKAGLMDGEELVAAAESDTAGALLDESAAVAVGGASKLAAGGDSVFAGFADGEDEDDDDWVPGDDDDDDDDDYEDEEEEEEDEG